LVWALALMGAESAQQAGGPVDRWDHRGGRPLFSHED
jgi:hypothetical protein